MSNNGILQIVLLLGLLLLLAKPLGLYMAFIYEGSYNNNNYFIFKFIKFLEQKIYKICKIVPEATMNWQQYAKAMLLFSFFSFMLVYIIQRLQILLPLNPEHFKSVNPELAFNTAASFITNTNWQVYSGENSLSYFTQMVVLTGQNFISPAIGMAILIALIRGILQKETIYLGNFWVDLVRGILYIFIPLSIALSLLLVSQGVPQNLKKYQHHVNLAGNTSVIPMGPVASQVAIKQLGTNGGGFFNANSSHPFENPTPFSNVLEMLAIMLIPAASCYMFGVMVRNIRQGSSLLTAMLVILVPCLLASCLIEQNINPLLNGLIQDHTVLLVGNMEGKEVRFGTLNSSIWSVITTATGNGSVNSMHDSFLPLGGLIPLWLINLGEVVLGGVGSGFYQLLIFVFITVFISGLMVGRTPEYLGKKIEAYEMKMVSLIILIMPLMVLVSTAVAVILDLGKFPQFSVNQNIHKFTEIFYAFSSMANNNGSSFSGLDSNSLYNVLGGIVMLVGRYFIAIPVLSIAGSLANKKIVPLSSGTLPTNSPLFISVLVMVILIVAALIFFPAFSLGPIVERLIMSNS